MHMVKKNRIKGRVITAVVLLAVGRAVMAQGVMSEWDQIQPPPKPILQQVTVDSAKTALLVMDFGQANCGREPRCVASIPNVKKLLSAARDHHMLVVYSGFPGLAFMPEIAPLSDDPKVVSRADKFYNTDLDNILKQHGVTTVIATGTSANGAELFTSFAAAIRGYQVIVPIDCMPGRSAYAEQSTVWGMANDPGLAPSSANAVAPPAQTAGAAGATAVAAGSSRGGAATLTSSSMIEFH